MRVIIRSKVIKSSLTNVKRDFNHVQAYSLDKENLVLELTHENTNYKSIYPLGYGEYVTIQPDTEKDV